MVTTDPPSHPDPDRDRCRDLDDGGVASRGHRRRRGAAVMVISLWLLLAVGAVDALDAAGAPAGLRLAMLTACVVAGAFGVGAVWRVTDPRRIDPARTAPGGGRL